MRNVLKYRIQSDKVVSRLLWKNEWRILPVSY